MPRHPTVIFTAAHAGFAHEAVPLGGGGAVADALICEWERAQPFALKVLTPTILAADAPRGRDIVQFSEKDYARFCREFERASTAAIFESDAACTAVIANDVSEGPDFQALAARGYPVFTIYHVDVVAYIAAIYGRGWVKPERLVRWFERLPWKPDILRLIFEKQRASVECSRGLIVPSQGMKDVLLRCYPATDPAKIHVLPWGTWAEALDTSAIDLRAEFAIPADAHILVTLSRISPEKGQHLLLEALCGWRGGPLWIFVCGEPAFMQGQRYFEKLQCLAAGLTNVRVIFAGYVTGARKRAFLELADLYIFPSIHESYGLTLLEALHAGAPAVCLDHLGARGVMRPEFGAIVRDGRSMRQAIERLLADPAARTRMGRAAKEYAAAQPFANSAQRLADVILEATQDTPASAPSHSD